MLRTLKDVDLRSKRVLVRVDYNVPLKSGKVSDDRRIKESLKTVKFLLKNNCRVILMSHLGRPDGRVVDEFKLDPVAVSLSKLLKKKVRKLDDCIGEKVEKAVGEMKAKDVVLLENLRFHQEEEKNDAVFSRKLAKLGDAYVNDAFGAAHRAHASTEGVAKFLPSCAGFLLEKEIEVLSGVLKNPQRPFVAVIGGAKVADKIGVIKNLIKLADFVFVGGAMMFTFYRAMGYSTGNSIVDEKSVELAKELLKSDKLLLPVDCVAAKDEKSPARTAAVSSIPAGLKGYDVGEKSIDALKKLVSNSKLVVWNGPLGMAEVKQFAKGTEETAKFISKSKLFSVVGGGDTLDVIDRLKLSKEFSHVSTGGGAMLEFLEGKQLPAIVALQK